MRFSGGSDFLFGSRGLLMTPKQPLGTDIHRNSSDDSGSLVNSISAGALLKGILSTRKGSHHCCRERLTRRRTIAAVFPSAPALMITAAPTSRAAARSRGLSRRSNPSREVLPERSIYISSQCPAMVNRISVNPDTVFSRFQSR